MSLSPLLVALAMLMPLTSPAWASADDGGAPAQSLTSRSTTAGDSKTGSADAGAPGSIAAGGLEASAHQSSSVDAGSAIKGSSASPGFLDAGAKINAPTSTGSVQPLIETSPDAGAEAIVRKGSHCQLTDPEGTVVTHESSGALLLCQDEVRREYRSHHCRPKERLKLIFSGESNGSAIKPFPFTLRCP